MVNRTQTPRRFGITRRNESAALTTELVVALGILVLALIPLGFSFLHESRLLRASYFRAVAMEIVDGEMEILAAGKARALPEGRQVYLVKAAAATNLPPGRFQLTKTGHRLRLEWRSDEHRGVGPIVREVTLK